jgi:hypothetical protein
MARADRNMPPVYFGQPGRTLVQLPWPRDGIDRPYERPTFDFLTGAGNHQVSVLSTGARAFSLAWKALHSDTFDKLNQYRLGMNGPGPWFLHDPSTTNLLPANVSAATALLNTATDFISLGGTSGVPGSNSMLSFVHRAQGTRSIRWRFTSTPITAPVLGIQSLYRSWPGHPCVPGLSYTFSSWCTVDGVVETSVPIRLKIGWYTAANTLIGTADSGATTVTGWVRPYVTAAAPSNAAYMVPYWELDGTAMAVNGIVYIDEPMLEQDAVVNDWSPGTGIKPLEVIGLTEQTSSFAARFRQGVAMQLRELAR